MFQLFQRAKTIRQRAGTTKMRRHVHGREFCVPESETPSRPIRLGPIRMAAVLVSSFRLPQFNRKTLFPPVAKISSYSTLPIVDENHSSSPSLPSVVPIGAPWQQVFLLARRQKKIYVEVFDLAPIKLTLSTAFQTDSVVSVIPNTRHKVDTTRSWDYRCHLGSSNPMGFARNVGLDIKDFLLVIAKGILQTHYRNGTRGHSLFSNIVYAISDAATQANGGIRIQDISLVSFENIIIRLAALHLDLDEEIITALLLPPLAPAATPVAALAVNEVVGASPLELVVNGAAASYEAYLKFLNKFPSIEKDWDLQLLPITSLRPLIGGFYSRLSSCTLKIQFGISILSCLVTTEVGSANEYWVCRVAAIPKAEGCTSTLPNWDFSMHTVNLRRAAGIPRAKGGAYVYSQDI
ncbi:hypothetical protein HHK36_001986 [Tetracentron sinense]|uniref:Uncharacterized protein n=1 Tax=Tetracentron sinense TaxID=13715 RepID=A0A835DSK3_TETSI|nr:hypothetical protein HHK36_001986 [Tetracentron sinense]